MANMANMRLMWKQGWRPRPLNSFLGFADLKLGVEIVLLFALLNKVAGVYGIIALFNGAGGSFAQVSMYVYSVLMLLALWWGLRAVAEEEPKQTLYFAHLFSVDHILSTAWTMVFAVTWWVYTPHDGRQQAHSKAQQHIIDVAGGGHNMTDAERAAAAMSIWKKENGTAAALMIAGWCSKIYFAILLYSYAIHLRRGSYRTLPRSNPAFSNDPNYIALDGMHYPEDILPEDEEAPADEYYGTGGASAGGSRRPPQSARTPGTSGSISSFADFISAPTGRGRRGAGSRPGSASFRSTEFAFPKSSSSRSASSKLAEEVDEVLFDSDEAGRYHGMTTTDENTSVSSAEAREEGSKRDR